MTPNIHYEKREIIGERMELLKGSYYWLGPDLTLRDCTVIIGAARRAVSLVSGQLINCTIQAKGPLKGLPWATMKLKGCRFMGNYIGNDFGFREDVDERWKAGGVEDCDFSEAQFEGGRFFNCDMTSVRLPRWPCFAFLDARRYATELARREWPGSFDSVIRTVCDPPKGTVASVWHAPTISKKSDTTVEELRAALEGAPGIFM